MILPNNRKRWKCRKSEESFTLTALEEASCCMDDDSNNNNNNNNSNKRSDDRNPNSRHENSNDNDDNDDDDYANTVRSNDNNKNDADSVDSKDEQDDEDDGEQSSSEHSSEEGDSSTVDMAELREKQIQRSLLFAILSAFGIIFLGTQLSRLMGCLFQKKTDDNATTNEALHQLGTDVAGYAGDGAQQA